MTQVLFLVGWFTAYSTLFTGAWFIHSNAIAQIKKDITQFEQDWKKLEKKYE
jgi:hypothetical protein